MTATLPAAPVKTPAGQDELRRRTRGLGQRFRTVLLLVDGQRPLSEVLSLALQAGAATSHFEELLRLGLVELPGQAESADDDELEPVPPLESQETAPGELGQPHVKDVELEVPAAAEAAHGLGTMAPLLQHDEQEAEAEPVAVFEEEAAVVRETAPREVRPAPSLHQAEPALAAEPAGDAVGEYPPFPDTVGVLESAEEEMPEPAAAASAAGDDELLDPRLMQQAALYRPSKDDLPPWMAASQAAEEPAAAKTTPTRAAKPGAPAPAAPVRRPARPLNEDVRHDPFLMQVRGLLLDALHLDPPPFGSRIYSRVSGATTIAELVEQVWEIERYMSRGRRSRGGMSALLQARDMLGLGNTMVPEDSRIDEDE